MIGEKIDIYFQRCVEDEEFQEELKKLVLGLSPWVIDNDEGKNVGYVTKVLVMNAADFKCMENCFYSLMELMDDDEYDEDSQLFDDTYKYFFDNIDKVIEKKCNELLE